MTEKEVAALREQIEEVDHVATVLWYDSVMDLSVPMELLPDEYYDVLNFYSKFLELVLYYI